MQTIARLATAVKVAAAPLTITMILPTALSTERYPLLLPLILEASPAAQTQTRRMERGKDAKTAAMMTATIVTATIERPRTPLGMLPLGISPLRHMPTPVKQILDVHFSRRSLTTVHRRFFFHLRPPLRLPALLDPLRVVGVRVGWVNLK